MIRFSLIAVLLCAALGCQCGAKDSAFPTIHSVQGGETMALIAQDYYGDPMDWVWIARANPEVNPYKMEPGDKLVVPAPGE